MGMAEMVGCGELGEAGLLDVGGCCEICHSTDAYPMLRVGGPCRVMLAGGGEAFVCCLGKRVLLKGHNPDHGLPTALPDERGVEA